MRIVVERSTSLVRDAGSATLVYDTRFFDNADYPDGTIPAGDTPAKYMRDGAGAIVLRPSTDLEQQFKDEMLARTLLALNNVSTLAELKTFLERLLRLLVKFL